MVAQWSPPRGCCPRRRSRRSANRRLPKSSRITPKFCPLPIPQELFRIDAPEGGFADADTLISAYDEAIANGALEGLQSPDGSELIAALSLPTEFDTGAVETEDLVEEEIELM